MILFHRLINNFIKIKPFWRYFVLISLDSSILLLCILFSTWLYDLSQFHKYSFENYFWIISGTWFLGIFIYFLNGQYKVRTLYSSSKYIFYSYLLRNFYLVFSISIILKLISNLNLPKAFLVLTWLLLATLGCTSRLLIRDLYRRFSDVSSNKPIRVVIYGAGAAGAQLASFLKGEKKYSILAFIDDNPNLWNRTIFSIPIYSLDSITKVKGSIDQVLLALPNISLKKKRLIFDVFKELNLKVLEIPSMDEIVSGRASINSLRPILIEDLLGRDTAPPKQKLLGRSIKDAVICVTGAGGSIGSELCRQILIQKPKKLILIERNEPSLYKISEDIGKDFNIPSKVVSILGSVCDENLIKKVFEENEVEIVFHAAAYKHVPLVENNPVSGLYNNVKGTYIICKIAKSLNLKNVMLVSTDKAVRPTNVMGASKRLSELIVQAFAKEENLLSKSGGNFEKIKFSMVRFGNVLNSSGSVVPLFKKQIESGGPVTLTHKDIYRYFMTISEATQLVIQANSLAKGGDVFHLDMGKPVKILDLAHQMINLSGLKVKEKNSNNDPNLIEIVFTGLRPGEKLCEELLIDGEGKKTEHDLIFRANESFIEPKILWKKLEKLDKYLHAQDVSNALNLLKELIPEWTKSNL